MSLENIFMDVKRAKQIKRDELTLGGLGLDLWRQLGANAAEERKQVCQNYSLDEHIVAVTKTPLHICS